MNVHDPDGHETAPYEAGLNLDHVGFSVVEQGIRDLVKILWKLGYKTICSCAGHERALEPYPWIAIPMEFTGLENQPEKLFRTVARFNISLGENGALPEALEAWILLPMNTPYGFTVYLQPYDNNQRRDPEKISQLRQASQKLALFIEQEGADIFGADARTPLRLDRDI
ncbi:MAG: hypothetical protein NTX14_00510 [Candidatus Nealsonbacteria bacterium]|nr:hypothetical protein [Candidatus Nealsonbacteria bacterium]